MKAITELRKRRAISPVIATVILVAVAITVAVAVSYWMSSIAGQYTSFEKVAIKSAYASRKYDTDDSIGWVIKMGLQNTGSSTSTLESLFINEKPISEYGTYGDETSGINGMIRWSIDDTEVTADTWTGWSGLEDTTSVSLESGDEATIYILILGKICTGGTGTTGDPYTYSDGLFSAGTTINVKFHSAGGMDYIKLVQLT